MIKTKIFCILILFSAVTAYSAQFTEAEIKNFISKPEKDLIAWLKKEGKSDKDITGYYLNVAEQVHMLHQYTAAKVLYKRALARKDIGNKMIPYLALLEITIQENNLKEAAKFHQEAVEFLKANPKFSNKEWEERLTVYKVQIAQKTTSEGLTKTERDSVQMPHNIEILYWHDLKQNLIEKKYDEAYKMIEGKDFSKNDINLQVLADVIYTGAKKKKDPLLCQKDYEKFPTSHENSYCMKLCGVLLEIKSGKKVSEKDFQKLKELIQLRYPENLYLEQVARDLAAQK